MSPRGRSLGPIGEKPDMKTDGVLSVIGWVLLAAAPAAPSPVRAATLVDLTLTPDGSADPPGDRIALALAFAAGERPLTIEVRAVLAPREPGRPATPVKAKGEAHRDAD